MHVSHPSSPNPVPEVARSASASLEESLFAAHVEMLYERNFLPVVMGIPFAGLLLVSLWSLVPGPRVVVWCVLKVATAAIRIWLTGAYHRRAPTDPVRPWESRYLAALLVDAMGWTLLGFLFGRSEQIVVVAGTVCSLIGVGAVGMVALSTHRLGSVVFGSPLLLPSAVYLTAQGTREGVFAGLSMLAFYALVLDHGRRVSLATDELLRLRFEISDARDLALAAARAKSEFLATMSHELRTPLNAVLGMASLLDAGELSDVQRSRVRIIRSSGGALVSLIGDILDFSKIESGRVELELLPVNLVRCVEDVLQMASASISEKGLDIDYELVGAVPETVRTDPTRLRQILVNLIANAVKFTFRGSVIVRVYAEHTDPEHTQITFEVTDTGMGMSPDVCERLFTPFSQADASIVRRFGGTGLGLAISRRLCEALGGEIEVESEEDLGSTFRFSILAGTLPEPPSTQPTLEGTVYVVADRVDAARYLVQHVTRLGMRAEFVMEERVREGREIADDALVLVDFRDPERQGLTLEALAGRPGPVAVFVDPGMDGPSGDPAFTRLERPFLVDGFVRFVRARGRSGARLTPSDAPTVNAGTLVLVVDDNAVNRLVTAQVLKMLGYRAASVDSGEGAIAYVRSNAVDVVLMDLQMPTLDGDAATERMLSDGSIATPKPLVIGLTASALAEDRERCLAAGMVDYLVKPVMPDVLAATLTRVLGTRARRQG